MRRGLLVTLAILMVVALGAVSAASVGVNGVGTLGALEGCTIGEVSVVPTNNGTNWTGFTISNTSATGTCNTRDIYLRVTYDTTGDQVAEASYYMKIAAAAYPTPVQIGSFIAASPKIYANNSYTTQVSVPPAMASHNFLSYYVLVNNKRLEE